MGRTTGPRPSRPTRLRGTCRLSSTGSLRRDLSGHIAPKVLPFPLGVALVDEALARTTVTFDPARAFESFEGGDTETVCRFVACHASHREISASRAGATILANGPAVLLC